MECLVKDGEKGSPKNPLTLDELGPFLCKLTGQDVKVRGYIPPKEIKMGILKDEFLSKKTDEKSLNFAKLSTDGSKSTQPVKMAMINTGFTRIKVPDAKAK